MGFEIGLASVDVTPAVGATMVGYTARQATEVGHALRAEALACRDEGGGGGGGGWVLVSMDTIGFTGEFSRRVRARMAEVTGLPAEAHVLCGTHTHSGPSTIVFGRGENLGEVDKAYLAELEEKLVALVGEAWSGARPGVFEAAWTSAPELGHNRRVPQEDGTWGNAWEDVEGRHDGFFDPAVLLVSVRRADGTREAVVVNYGVHPVTLGPQSLALSGDYVGYMKDRVEAATGARCMFVLAACGNINPRTCIRVGAEYPRAMGEALAEVVLSGMGDLKEVADGPVARCAEPWRIERTREGKKGRRKVGDVTETEVVAARAGGVGMLALPGELFSEFNRPMREVMGAMPATLMVTLANEYPGYIPTDAAQAAGGYETSMAPCDGLEGAVMERVRAAAKGVREEVKN